MDGLRRAGGFAVRESALKEDQNGAPAVEERAWTVEKGRDAGFAAEESAFAEEKQGRGTAVRGRATLWGKLL